MTDSLIDRFRAKGSVTRLDKIETAGSLTVLNAMVGYWPDMTEADRNAVAVRRAELQKGSRS